MRLILAVVSVCTVVNAALQVTLVHTNDMHAHIDQINAQAGLCFGDGSNCYGGFARVKKAVDEVKMNSTQEGRATIFLNAGDNFQGTVYYTIYKWRSLAPLMNLLDIDVMCLGNHEFDDGPEGLVPYIQNISIPIVACNLDFSKEPLMQNTSITPSKILTVNGVQIGVIGYLTPNTRFLSNARNVIFLDEIESIKKEARKLTEQGVGVIVALGHSGYTVDQKIAASVPEVDIVVGGHSHSFLYTGTPPDIDVPIGPYPTVVVQPSGKKVPVVQAYAFTKYLGVLKLDINDDGDITSWEGRPMLLNSLVQKDAAIQAIVDDEKRSIKGEVSERVGVTKVLLEGGSVCRQRECNLGNMIADSMVDFSARLYVGPGWMNAALAIVNGGAIRTSITTGNEGYITYGDLLTTMPFENVVVRVEVRGQHLLQALENSVARFNKQNLPGAFLQLSGLKVTYNMTKPANSRVMGVEVRCANCSVPAYYPLRYSQVYSVLMNGYLASGGDAYTMFSDKAISKTITGDSDSLLLEEYIKKYSPVFPENNGRIIMLDDSDNSSNCTSI